MTSAYDQHRSTKSRWRRLAAFALGALLCACASSPTPQPPEQRVITAQDLGLGRVVEGELHYTREPGDSDVYWVMLRRYRMAPKVNFDRSGFVQWMQYFLGCGTRRFARDQGWTLAYSEFDEKEAQRRQRQINDPAANWINLRVHFFREAPQQAAGTDPRTAQWHLLVGPQAPPYASKVCDEVPKELQRLRPGEAPTK